MNLNICKKLGTAILSLFIIAGSISSFNAADTIYAVNELEGMTISLPDGMNAVTRTSKSDDNYFLLYGLDYNTVMKHFKNSDIYFQGMDTTASVTLTVTMTETDESKAIKNYSVLEADKLGEIQNNFLSMPEYTACTPDQSGSIMWLNFSTAITNEDSNIEAYQANTVYEGMSINLTYQRNDGKMTADDYKKFDKILSSVRFKEKSMMSQYLDPNNPEFYILFGGAAVILAFLIIMLIFMIRANNRKKHKKNSRILEELVVKYQLDEDKEAKKAERLSMFENFEEKTAEEDDELNIEDVSDIVYFDMKDDGVSTFENPSDEKSEKIINIMQNTNKSVKNEIENEIISEYFENDDESSDFSDNSEVIQSAHSEIEEITEEEELKILDTQDDDSTDFEPVSTEEVEETEDIEETESTEEIQNIEVINDAKEIEEITEPIDLETKPNEILEAELIEENDEVSENKTNTEKKIFIFKEEVAESQINNSLNFDDSDDFFDEAPTKKNGIIRASALKDAEDYDVISEVEERAHKLETAEDNKDNKALETVKKVGGSVKYFGVHCGYFCTNVYRMIKRKNAAKKRKKAEEIRREQRRRKEALARQQRERQANGELVQVRSRNDRRPVNSKSVQRHSSQKRRPNHSHNKK